MDARLSGSGQLNVAQHNEKRLPVRIGFCNDNFPPGQSGFLGDLDDVRWYRHPLSPVEIVHLYEAHKNTGK